MQTFEKEIYIFIRDYYKVTIKYICIQIMYI
jgi:hypothetical protein